MIDASDISDAPAQDRCASNCTGSGALRTVTADTDPAPLARGGTILTPGTATAVASGPFVLTDARMNSNAAGASTAAATFWIVPASQGCGGALTELGDERRIGFVRGQGAPDTPTVELHAVRYVVAADEVLCTAGRGIVAWAGFRPYE